MNDLREIDRGQIVHHLKRWASGRAQEIDDLFFRLQPRFMLDRASEQIVFAADPSTKTVTLGNRGSCRLQAHAYAGSICLTALATPGYIEMTPEERGRLHAPADLLLTWAVGRDLQQWLHGIEGRERDLDDIMSGAKVELPGKLLGSLSEQQRVFGEGLFRLAICFIILHELAHLDLKHSTCSVDASIRQEREADCYAARWLLEAPGITRVDRLNCLFAVTITMMWLTVLNVYLGPSESQTHPESYERLYDLLDAFIDERSEDERLVVWDFTARTLFVHVDNAGIEVDAAGLQGSPKDQVKYLVGLISKKQPWA
jgi:hypothetical protein